MNEIDKTVLTRVNKTTTNTHGSFRNGAILKMHSRKAWS